MLKIISWNINGLQSSLKQGVVDKLSSFDGDIVCLQETKTEKTNLNQFDKLSEKYSYYASFSKRKGYAGVAILSRFIPIKVMHGFGISKIDEEARVLAMEFHDFFIVNIYAPNAQLGLARLPYRNEWDALLFSLITELHVRKPIILCGDFNVAHRENDVGSNYINSNFPGCSKLERDNFDKLLSLGFTDVLRVCESTEKLATWWPYTAPNRGESQGLRFDYILASGCLTDKLIKSEILRDIFGSDHCPILAEFELDFSKENIFQPETKQVQCRLL